MIYLPLAIEIANDRSREAAKYVQQREMARAAAPSRGPRRPNPLRALAARPVRALGDASHALSEAACLAAIRIEGGAR